MTIDTRYFALAVRIVGLFVLCQAIPAVAYNVIGIAAVFRPELTTAGASPPVAEAFWSWLPRIVHDVLQLAFGLYLIAGGGAIARWCIRSCEFNCPRCGYDLHELKADRCPECGSINALLPPRPS